MKKRQRRPTEEVPGVGMGGVTGSIFLFFLVAMLASLYFDSSDEEQEEYWNQLTAATPGLAIFFGVGAAVVGLFDDDR